MALAEFLEISQMPQEIQEITLLLAQAKCDPVAEDRLFRLVENRLRQTAERLLQKQSPGHSLQQTLLADDAFLKLMRTNRGEWANRDQFFAVAARVMRQIIISHARTRTTVKRGGNELRATPLAEDLAPAASSGDPQRLVELAELVERLEREHPKAFRVFDLHYFFGFELQEIADDLLHEPYITVKRRWQSAKAFLQESLTDEEPSLDD